MNRASGIYLPIPLSLAFVGIVVMYGGNERVWHLAI